MAKRRSGPKTLAPPLPLTGNERERALTYPGMAHFGGTGPAGKSCRECAHWKHEGYYAFGNIRPARCAQAEKMNKAVAVPVPDNAPACRYFAENNDPPKRYRGQNAFG